jgi:hypothetical protein
MNATEQVAYESRVRMRYAVIAFCAALLIVGGQLISLSGTHTDVDELTLDLITINRRFPLDLISAIVNASGLFALMAMLIWTHLISRARNLAIRSWIRWLATFGVVVITVGTIPDAIMIAIKAHDFVSTGNQSYPQAEALTSGLFFAIASLLADLGALVLAAAVIWISLNALRVGLVTRPLGYLGVVAGALVLFPIGAFAQFLQGLWLVGMSVTFAGRWPNGTPPAWTEGIAVPWQPPGQPRAQQTSVRGGGGAQTRRARRGDVAAAVKETPAAAPTPLASGDEAPGARRRANTPKRKRKHRG